MNSFGVFTDRILQLSNETFSTLYKNVLKKYWHDGSFMAKMSRNYAHTDWPKGIYEVYIPTRDDPAMNLRYYRIVIKVLPNIDAESAHVESVVQQAPQQTPMGIVDSELIVLVAPHLKRRGFIRGWRHIKHPGYLTAVIVSKIPEIAFKRILTLVANFLEKRIDKLLEKLGFQPWEYDYIKKEEFYYKSVRSIIERYSYVIAVSLKSFSHVLAWVKGKLRSVLHEIGLMNMMRQAFKPLNQLSRKDQILIVQRMCATLGLPLKIQSRTGTVTQMEARFKPLPPREEDEALKHLEKLATATPLQCEPDRASVKRRQSVRWREDGEGDFL